MVLCLFYYFIFMAISIFCFICAVTDKEILIEKELKVVFSSILFILSTICLVYLINYRVKTKIKNTASITETSKIIVDGKEYEGKIIDKKLNNFVQLKTKDETLTIIEPKSITTKN